MNSSFNTSQNDDHTSSRFSQFLKAIDGFGLPITLFYKGSSRFKTEFGGILTIVSVLLIVAYFISQIMRVLNFENTTRTSSYYRDLFVDTTIYSLNASNFDFAIGFQSRSPLFTPLDWKEFLNIRMYQMQTKAGENGNMATIDEYTYSLCTSDRFMGESSFTEFQIFQDGFYCADNIDFQVQSSMFSSENMQFMIGVDKCTQTVLDNLYPDQNLTCRSEDEIQKYLLQMNFQFLVLNSYFDLNDNSDTFIKPHITTYAGFIQDQTHYQRSIGISQNVAIRRNSWTGLSLFDEEVSYISSKLSSTQQADVGHMLFPKRLQTFILQMDDEVVTVEKDRMNIIDVLSSTGGIIGLVFASFRIIIHFFQRVQLFAMLVKHNLKFEDVKPKKNKVRLGKTDDFSECVQQLDGKSEAPESYSKDNEALSERENWYWKSLMKVQQGISISYGVKDIFLKVFVKTLCRGRQNQALKQKYFERGQDIMTNELDIRNILAVVRFAKQSNDILWSKGQKYLLRLSNHSFVTYDEVMKQKKRKQLMLRQSTQKVDESARAKYYLKNCVQQAMTQNSRIDRKILEQILPKSDLSGLEQSQRLVQNVDQMQPEFSQVRKKLIPDQSQNGNYVKLRHHVFSKNPDKLSRRKMLSRGTKKPKKSEQYLSRQVQENTPVMFFKDN